MLFESTWWQGEETKDRSQRPTVRWNTRWACTPGIGALCTLSGDTKYYTDAYPSAESTGEETEKSIWQGSSWRLSCQFSSLQRAYSRDAFKIRVDSNLSPSVRYARLPGRRQIWLESARLTCSVFSWQRPDQWTSFMSSTSNYFATLLDSWKPGNNSQLWCAFWHKHLI